MKSVFSRFILVALVLSTKAYAVGNALGTIGSSSENDQRYNTYYFFTDKPANVRQQQFQNPANFAREALRATAAVVGNSMNLLVWQEYKKPLPVSPVSYDRRKHFGTWIVDGRNGNCLSVRAQVLVRDSRSQVGMVPGSKCVVGQGNWLDPYGNRVYSSAKDIQIDHMVPLKHAFIAGAWQWDAKVRCLYANYMGYRGHLVAASGTENQSKSDGTPFSYLPPNKNYVCTYLAEWLRIKLIWNLALIPPEVQAIANAYKKYSCSSTLFEVNLDELKAQRKWMQDNRNLCDYNTAPDYSNQSPAPQQQ